jgi:DNA-binding transcriptional ArsR family regulator
MNDACSTQTSSPVFDRAAELFGVLSTPFRLRIVCTLCNGEKNVSQLLIEMNVSQPNMSRHLSVLYRSGVVAKRRNGAQVFYRIAEQSLEMVRTVVCPQVRARSVDVCVMPGGEILNMLKESI